MCASRDQAQVLGQCPGQHVTLLGQQHDPPTQLHRVHIGQVDAAESDPAGVGRQQPGGELGDRGFAGSGRADERDVVPGGQPQRHVVQHRTARDVSESDAVKHQLATGAVR